MNRAILRLAIPNIISNLTVPLIGTVDTALMGHSANESHIGAIALGTMIFNFLYWGFGFLRMGTTGLTAQAYGENDQKAMINILGRAIFTALTVSLFLFLLQKPIIWGAFQIISANESVEALSRSYFQIRIFAAPATIALYAFYGWFMGMQNGWYLMIVSITANGCNIIGDILLVHYWDLASDGVALGTVIAQYIGALLAIGLFLKRYRHLLPLMQQKAILQFQAIKRFFAVNFDIFIRTLCLIFTFSFFTAKSAAIGETTLAVNQILLQFIFILSFGVDGFAFAAESLVGKFTGIKDETNLKKSIHHIFYWGMGLAAITSLTYWQLGHQLLSIFTDKAHLIDHAWKFMPWVALAPLIFTPGFIWDGIFIGATQSKPMRNTLLIATIGGFLPVFFIFRPFWGNHGLWLAFTTFMLIRGVVLSYYYRTHILALVRNF